MKKTAVAALVAALVAGGYVGASWYTGQRVARGYDEAIARAQQDFPFLRIEDRQVDTGLFSSTYTAKLRLGCGPAEDPSRSFVIGLRDRVQHGPLPGFSTFAAARIDSQVLLPDNAPEALRRYWAGVRPQDIRTVLGYGGAYRSELRLPAGEFTAEGAQARWAPLTLRGSGKLDGSDLRIEGDWPELQVRSTRDGQRGDGVLVRNLRLEGSNPGSGSFWLRPGTSTLAVDSVELQYTRAPESVASVTLAKLTYRTDVEVAQELMQARVAIGADASVRLKAGDAPFELQNLEFVESVQRIHGPTLEKVMLAAFDGFSAACADASAEPAQAAPPPPPAAAEATTAHAEAEAEEAEDGLAAEEEGEGGDGAAAARTAEMLKTLAQLLPHNPEFAVEKLAVGFQGQRGELSYTASVPGLTAEEMADMAALQQKMVLQARARLPVAWLEAFAKASGHSDDPEQHRAQAQLFADLALGKGWAVREGDHLVSTVQMAQGDITVNGKPLKSLGQED